MDQVQEIKSKVDIVSVISETVTLRKAGRNYQGLCPFHNERTPSFSVSQELQIYKCFGCGESGDVITFLEKNEGLEFIEALKILADKAGIKLKKVDTHVAREKDELKEANEAAVRFYNYILLAHKKGEDARKYLSDRGLKINTVKLFKLGYAPEEPNLLTKNLSKKYSLKVLEDAGLIYRKNGVGIDRFRGRVIYPINDIHGDTISLAGRILPKLSDRGLAKYINSPQTKIYNKSRSLFGLDKSKKYIKEKDCVVLVEGEMDFLSSFQSGVKNIVAIKGTALTIDHITILSRFTKNITLALDSDFAGDNAALKGIALAQNSDMQIKAVDLGRYKDPDEFAQAEPKEFLKKVETAVDVWEFLIDKLSDKYDLSTASGKQTASATIIPFLSEIENEIVREHYIQRLSQVLDISVSAVQKESIRFEKDIVVPQKEILEITPHSKRSVDETREEEFVITMLRYYPKVLSKDEISSEIHFPFTKRLVNLARNFSDMQSFSRDLPNEMKEKFSEIAISLSDDLQNPKPFVEKLFFYIKVSNLSSKINKLQNELAIFEKESNDNSARETQIMLQKLLSEKQKLEEVGKLAIID